MSESMTAYEARLAIYAAIERTLTATDANGQPFFVPGDAWQIRCAPEDFNAVSEAARSEPAISTTLEGHCRLVLLPDPAFPPGVVMATPVDLASIQFKKEGPWS